MFKTNMRSDPVTSTTCFSHSSSVQMTDVVKACSACLLWMSVAGPMKIKIDRAPKLRVLG